MIEHFTSRLLCSILLNKNLDFDILNSDAADNFKVEDGKLVNKLNGMTFSIFVLPLTEILSENMVKLLNEFTAEGGKVITYKSDVKDIAGKNGEHFTEKAFEALNTSSYENTRKISDVAQICKKTVKLPFEIVCGVDEVSRSQMSYSDQLHDPYIHDGEQQYGVGVARYIKSGKRILNFTKYKERQPMKAAGSSLLVAFVLLLRNFQILRYCSGVTPTVFLKILKKYLTLSYPTALAT